MESLSRLNCCQQINNNMENEISQVIHEDKLTTP